MAFLASNACVSKLETDADVGTGDDAENGGSATEGGDDDGSTGDTIKFERIPARGISISFVEANHGVEVPVLEGGEWVDGPARNAQLIKGRNTLLRALWEIEDGFEPREIEAELTLFLPGGDTEVGTTRMVIEGPSSQSGSNNAFFFIVPGELMVPGVHYQIRLYETDFGYEDTPEPQQTAWPAEPSFVGIEAMEMELRVVLVPIKHDLGPNCPDAPELDEESLKVLHRALFNQNPVEHVEMIVHPGITYTSGMSSFGGILSTLANLHDPADPGTYVYGVVRPCDGGPEGVGGQAISIPGFPSQDNAWSRTAVGRWYPSISSTADTFVHEIGHTQGRRHVRCNGNEGGPDPSYPHEGGSINVWGFGALDFTMRTPASKDYMTYCGSTWVSDWGWQKVIPYIREITSWYASGAPLAVDEQNTILVGLIDPDAGTEDWFTTWGSATGRSLASDRIEITTAAGRTELEATIGEMGEGNAYNVVVELPRTLELEQAQRITWIHADDTRSEIAEVRTGPTSLKF